MPTTDANRNLRISWHPSGADRRVGQVRLRRTAHFRHDAVRVEQDGPLGQDQEALVTGCGLRANVSTSAGFVVRMAVSRRSHASRAARFSASNSYRW